MTDAIAAVGGEARTVRPAVWPRLVIGSVVLAMLVGIAYLSGLDDLVRDTDAFRDRVDSWGIWGPLGFLAIFTGLVAVGVPGLVFVIAAIAIWSQPVAFVLCWTGALTSSAPGVLMGRHVGRASLEHRLPDRFHRFDALLQRWPLPGIIVLRMFVYLHTAADWLVGMTSIPMRTVWLGTAIGMAVPTAFVVFVGPEALDGARGLVGRGPFPGFFALVAVVGVLIVRRYRSRQA
ncbi:MAG TPA: VTT domain-containing protein [Acidimicrobiales bacterium]